MSKRINLSVGTCNRYAPQPTCECRSLGICERTPSNLKSFQGEFAYGGVHDIEPHVWFCPECGQLWVAAPMRATHKEHVAVLGLARSEPVSNKPGLIKRLIAAFKGD